MSFRQTSSYSDADASEASFMDMLRSTKKPAPPEADASTTGATESVDANSGSHGRSSKKKGKKRGRSTPRSSASRSTITGSWARSTVLTTEFILYVCILCADHLSIFFFTIVGEEVVVHLRCAVGKAMDRIQVCMEGKCKKSC